jgi:hypothetical protein
MKTTNHLLSQGFPLIFFIIFKNFFLCYCFWSLLHWMRAALALNSGRAPA